MTREQLAGRIDLTLLRPDAGKKEIEEFVKRALKYPFASVCVPPCHVGLAAGVLKGAIKVCTVAGFPLGYSSPGVKLNEARSAHLAGASEIDVVMNLSLFKSNDPFAKEEVSEIVRELPGCLVKVIIETCYLTDEEKVRACRLAMQTGARFVKTSTGFGPGGATVSDVRLLAGTAQGWIKVKASAGIKSLDDALKMLIAGAERLGTSSGIKIVEELKG